MNLIYVLYFIIIYLFMFVMFAVICFSHAHYFNIYNRKSV